MDTIHETEESRLRKAPAYSIDLELRKSQSMVFVKGKMKLEIGLLCSRCANGFGYPVKTSFECLYTQDRSYDNTTGNQGTAYSEPTGAAAEDLEIEFLDKEYLELADVLREQIYLQIPFQPLCKDGCKGICPVCGQDQNVQPCQCFRLKNPALANALKRSVHQGNK